VIDVTGEVAQIVAAFATAVGVIVVAIITTRTRHDARRTREQVENDHDTNLRVELDERHKETRGWFSGLARDIGGIREELRGIRSSQQALDRRVQRLEDIEMTDPGRKRT